MRVFLTAVIVARALFCRAQAQTTTSSDGFASETTCGGIQPGGCS